ncbi:hypothetical protein EYC84_000570 [Monilinia fructicola]|uniref:ATP-dependent RNA helicase n=1 Tax=Monilinia fructicola TaxID=38448 RepID=A0A5M9JRB8_MONFR|nr:hypothetical protein EYC84_000570 [Monilinia fructicola]
MADDGMLMNFEIGDVPIIAKQSFKGGRWKDRLAAKKTAQHRVTKTTNKPSTREIFAERQYDTGPEEYIGRGSSSRAPKRQRVDDHHETYGGRNENIAAYASGKLPSGSINIGGGRKTTFQEETRPAFVAGKLPPGSINVGGKKAIPIQEETRPAFVSGKLPPGSINSGVKKAISFQEDTRPAYVSGKLPHGSINGMRNREMAAVHREIAEGGRKPGQVVSSLFTFNPTSKKTFDEPEEELEPAKPSNAPLTEEMATFTNLGLSRRLAAHLSTKLDMKAPTAIQKASVSQLISDDSDAFIQAETGSGKTLAYLLPIVERILALSENGVQIHRDSGLFAIILSPTRELCKQIAAVLEKVLRCAPWIVGTTVNGGESKQSEKARLRKGVNILVATPGRLADHLDNTEVLNVATVRWLVLDEGDRLMELGFEEEIKGIVEKIGRRSVARGNSEMMSLPKRRVTILCSATMKMNVQRLGEISLKDAVHIQADPSEQEKQDKENGIETEDKAFSAPTQLKQSYAIVPAKLRLVTLTALLKRAFCTKGVCDEGNSGAEDDEKPNLPTLPKTELTKDTIAHGTTISNNSNPVILHKLHGSLAQNIRTATLKAFSESADPCVMICTDVASRGLDLPNVDFVIEYDPPFSAEDHLHRVGRTARAGREGRALIFLMPGTEEDYVTILASGKASVVQVANGKKGLRIFQLEVERWSLDSPRYLEMARRGYQSHIRAYATHVADERHIFNMQTLHLGHLAKAFALRDKPGSIKVPGLRPAKMTKADRSVAARKAKRGEKEEEKAPEGERVRKQRKMELDLPTVDSNEAAARMKRKMKEHMASASEFNIG